MKIKNQMKGLQLIVFWLLIPLVQSFGNNNYTEILSVELVSPNAGNNVYEGCGDPYILIDGNNISPDEEIIFSVTLTGSALIELDYAIEYEYLLFNTIDNNNGQFIIPLNIISDGISEPMETIHILVQPICGGCSSSELTVFVHDPLEELAVMSEDTVWVCPSDTLTINPDIINAFVELDYIWSDGSTLPIYTDPNPTTGIVSLILSDACGAEVEFDYYIQTIEVQATMDNSSIIACGSLEGVELPVYFSGPGPYDLVFSFNGIIQDTITNIETSTYYLPVLGDGEYTLHYVNGDACEGSVIGSRKVILRPFSIALNASIVTCYGGNDGTASIQINEGTAPYSITWENGINDTTITGLESDYYFVSLVDFSGCIFEDSIFVPQNPPMAFVTDIIQQPNCIDSVGGSIEVSFECESYSYEWNIATENSMLLDSLGIGEYIVTATNDLGCVTSDTIPLLGDFGAPPINIEGIDTLNCLNNFGNLEVVGLNNNDHSYQWETSDGLITGDPSLSNILVGVAGNYEVHVMNVNNGCQDSSFIQVFEDFEFPDVLTNVIDTIDCYNGGVPIYGTGSSVGGSFLYVWSTFDGQINGAIDQINAEAVVGGLYTLSVINANNGCISSSDLIVEDVIDNPDILLSTDGDLTCVDSIVLINAVGSDTGPNFVYNWTNQHGEIIQNPSDAIIEVSSAGIYVLEIQNTDNGCSSQQEIEVILDDVIPQLTYAEPDFFNCYNDSIIIETQYAGNSNDLIYNWSTTDSVSLVTNEGSAIAYTPGSVILSIENQQNGCLNNYSFDLFENYNAPDLTIQDQDEFLNCALGTLSINAENNSSGLFSYVWTGLEGQTIISGQNSLDPQISQTGNYELFAIDVLTGCTDSETIEILGDTIHPNISFSDPTVLTCALTETIIIADTSGYENLNILWSSSSSNQINVIDDITVELLSPGLYTAFVENTQNNCISEHTIEVLADTVTPQLIVQSDFSLGCDDEDVLFDATASDSGPNFSIDWDINPSLLVDPLNPYLATITEAGVYGLSLLNTDNGCSSYETFEVYNDNTLPQADFLPIAVLNCLDTIVEIGVQGTGTYSYLWSTSEGTIESDPDSSIIQVSSTGDYEVLIIDNGNGCQHIMSLNVDSDTAIPEMNILPYGQLDCSNASTILALQTDELIPLNFSWVGPGIVSGLNQSFVEVQEPGAYSVLVTNTQNNCIWESSYPVLQDLDYPVVNIVGLDTLTCDLNEIILTAQTDNETLYNLAWSSPQVVLDGAVNDSDLFVSTPATYQIEVVNPLNGCSVVETVLVEADQEAPLIAEIIGEDITCDLDQVWLEPILTGTDDYVYLWSSVEGNIISGNTDSVILVNEAGSYDLLIENPNNGCLTESTIDVKAFKEAPKVDLESSYILNCDQAILSFDLGLDEDRVEVLWMNDNGSVIETGVSNISFDSEGSYSVYIEDTDTGCDTEESFDVIDHRLKSLVLENEQPICSDPYGYISILEVEGSIEPFDYFINGKESVNNDTDFEFLEAGDYLIEVEDKYGCSLSQEITIKELPELDLGIESSKLIEEGEGYQVEMNLNFDEATITSVEWSPPLGVSCVDCLEPLLSPEAYQVYAVEVVTDEGCLVEHQLQLFVRDDRSVFSPNVFTPNGDGDNDRFMVYATDDYISIQAFKIFDRWGELVYSNDNAELNNTEDGWDGNFLNRALQAAVYTWYVELLDDKGNIEQFSGDIMLYR